MKACQQAILELLVLHVHDMYYIHVCMYVRMHVYMYVCTYACMYVCMYVCMYGHTYCVIAECLNTKHLILQHVLGQCI